MPGSHESGDGFGTSAAWGDVNGDGYADLAIGAPGEDDTSGHADRGAVTVMYGPALDTGFSYTTSGVTSTGARLGSTVAVGDFNGDGKADVFSAGTGKGGNWNARLTGGATTYGTLTTATGAVSYLDAATGDFNRDGYADIAVNYRDTGGIGRVVRFAGSATGLTKVGVISVKGAAPSPPVTSTATATTTSSSVSRSRPSPAASPAARSPWSRARPRASRPPA